MTIKQFKHDGFTLIELVIVIVIMGVIAVASSQLLATGLTAYLTNKNIINATAQARLALERMTRDIRAVRTSADISAASATQFTFVDTNGSSVAYSLSGTNLMRNSQILAHGISGLTFTYYDENGNSGAAIANIKYITILLNVTEGNTNFSVDTSVYPRNLL